MGRRRVDRSRLVIIRTSITLRRGEDDDLIRFFEGQPQRKRAAAIRTALRAGGLAAIQAQQQAQDEQAIDELLDNLV